MQASTCPASPSGTGTNPPGAGNLERRHAGGGGASPGSGGRPLGSSWTSTVQTPNTPWRAAGGCWQGDAVAGSGGCRDPDRLCLPEHRGGRLHYGLTVKPSAVIKISFLKIKYLSGNMISSCKEPGLVSARGGLGQRAVPRPGQGSGPVTRDTALVRPAPSAALSLSDPAKPLVLSV